MRRRRVGFMAMVVAAVFALAGCGSGGDQSAGDGKLTVVTSFYPLAYVVQEVGGDQVSVIDLTPPGGEAHDLELSPRQVSEVAQADVVVYMGGGFQPAVENSLSQASGLVVDVRDGVPENMLIPGDPHLWLNPLILADIGDQVAEALSSVDENANADFSAGAAGLRTKMEDLNAKYSEGLAHCKGATLVSSHEAFGYLAAQYDLEQVGIAGLDPETEPSPKRLLEIQQLLADRNVTTVFFESTDASDQRLAASLDAKAGHLNTLESAPSGGDYQSEMETNLTQLVEGLNCGS